MSEEHDIGAADEQALREMFAALVADAAPSEQSPLEVQRLARAERQSGVERRARRLRYTRNALVAAVLIGIVAWVAPRFVTSSSSTATAASSSSSSSAAASAAGTFAADGGAAAAPQTPGERTSAGAATAPAASAAGGFGTAASSAASSAPASAAATSGPMSSGPASSAAAPASSAPASSSSASSSAASSGAASSAASGGAVACVPVPPAALDRVRAALPGYRGTVRITSCTSGTSAGSVAGTTTFVLAGRPVSTCTTTTPCPPVPSSPLGTPIPGTKDAYGFREAVLVVGANGLRVTVSTTPGGPSRAALITAARALLGSLR